jgi:hypothetical protein
MNPQSLNLYGYVNNNPLSKADADGHECIPCEQAIEYISETPAGQAVGSNLSAGAAVVGSAIGAGVGYLATHVGEIANAYSNAVANGGGQTTAVYVGPIMNKNTSNQAPGGPHAPGDVPNGQSVVRGGQGEMPASGTYSGAQGATVEEAGKGVPHGTIRPSTGGEIRAAGGDVRPAPEPAYPGGPVNGQHVNVTGGQSAFGAPQANPAPKPQRVPSAPKPPKDSQ